VWKGYSTFNWITLLFPEFWILVSRLQKKKEYIYVVFCCVCTYIRTILICLLLKWCTDNQSIYKPGSLAERRTENIPRNTGRLSYLTCWLTTGLQDKNKNHINKQEENKEKDMQLYFISKVIKQRLRNIQMWRFFLSYLNWRQKFDKFVWAALLMGQRNELWSKHENLPCHYDSSAIRMVLNISITNNRDVQVFTYVVKKNRRTDSIRGIRRTQIKEFWPSDVTREISSKPTRWEVKNIRLVIA
jgi:hypothetical protein